MIDLARIAQAEVVLLLALLAAAVLFQTLSGRIHLRGLFADKTTGTFDPARLQLFMLTLFTAGELLLGLPEMRGRPTVAFSSGALLALFGGSQGVYLFQKFSQMRAMSKGGRS